MEHRAQHQFWMTWMRTSTVRARVYLFRCSPDAGAGDDGAGPAGLGGVGLTPVGGVIDGAHGAGAIAGGVVAAHAGRGPESGARTGDMGTSEAGASDRVMAIGGGSGDARGMPGTSPGARVDDNVGTSGGREGTARGAGTDAHVSGMADNGDAGMAAASARKRAREDGTAERRPEERAGGLQAIGRPRGAAGRSAKTKPNKYAGQGGAA